MQITYPIEQVISGLPGLTEVRSISKFGLSQVSAIFQDGFDILCARQLVSERIITAELPEQAGMHKPELAPITSGMGEVFHYLSRATGYDLAQLRTLQRLGDQTPAALDSRHGRGEQLGRLRKAISRPVRSGTARQVRADVRRQSPPPCGRTTPTSAAATCRQAGKVLLVQGVGLVDQRRPDRRHRRPPARRPSRSAWRDVADVEIGHEIRRRRRHGRRPGRSRAGPGLHADGREQPRGDPAAASTRSRKSKNCCRPASRFASVYDRSDLVDKVIVTARDNLFHGGLLVVAVLFVLGGGWRAGLIVAAGDPAGHAVCRQ